MDVQVDGERQPDLAEVAHDTGRVVEFLRPLRIESLVTPIGRGESLILLAAVAVLAVVSLWEPAKIVFRWDATSRMIAHAALTLSFAFWVAGLVVELGLVRRIFASSLGSRAQATGAVIRVGLVVGAMLLLLSARGTNSCAVAVAVLCIAETALRDLLDRAVMRGRAGEPAGEGNSRFIEPALPALHPPWNEVPDTRSQGLLRLMGVMSVGWTMLLAFTPVGSKGASALGFQSGRGLVAIAILSHVLLIQGGGLLRQFRRAAAHRCPTASPVSELGESL